MLRLALLYCAGIACFLSGCSAFSSTATLSDDEIQKELDAVTANNPFYMEGHSIDGLFMYLDYKIINNDKCTIKLLTTLLIIPEYGVYWDGACKNGQATGLGQVYVRYESQSRDYLVDASDESRVYFYANNNANLAGSAYIDNTHFFELSNHFNSNSDLEIHKIYTMKGLGYIDFQLFHPYEELNFYLRALKDKNYAFTHGVIASDYYPADVYGIKNNTDSILGMGLSDNNKDVIVSYSRGRNKAERIDFDGNSLGPVILEGSFLGIMMNNANGVESTFSSKFIDSMVHESQEKIIKYFKSGKCKTKSSVPKDISTPGAFGLCNYHHYLQFINEYMNEYLPERLKNKHLSQRAAKVTELRRIQAEMRDIDNETNPYVRVRKIQSFLDRYDKYR